MQPVAIWILAHLCVDARQSFIRDSRFLHQPVIFFRSDLKSKGSVCPLLGFYTVQQPRILKYTVQ